MRDLIDGSRPRRVAPSFDELRELRGEILEVCARNGASNVWVFGSVARGEQDAQSDVDLLVDLEAGRGLFDLAGVVAELEDLLGCPVNVVEHASLSDDRFSRWVRREMVPL